LEVIRAEEARIEANRREAARIEAEKKQRAAQAAKNVVPKKSEGNVNDVEGDEFIPL